MENKNYDVTKTFPKWKEQEQPYFTHAREGTEVKAKRFKIYEDKMIKVCRVEEPTFISEHDNTIQVHIKSPFILFDMAIGGCINRNDAIENAKILLRSYFGRDRRVENIIQTLRNTIQENR